jgi:predicted O-methyltransferase YrrM
MDTLNSDRVAAVLQRLFTEAEAADGSFIAGVMSGQISTEQLVAKGIAAETADLRGLCRSNAEHFFAIAPEFGRFLYICARARKATRIVEFGTSMGISAIHLAAALRDMNVRDRGGQLIGTEIEPSKVARARANLEAAGLADLVDIREGDARETLRHIDGDIDLVLLDGAFKLYLDVLKTLEPHLKPGALIIAENAFEQADGYLRYVRDPANGFLSQSLALSQGRDNELTVVT